MRLILVFFTALLVIAFLGGEQNHRNKAFEDKSQIRYIEKDLLSRAKTAVDNIPAKYTSNKNQYGVVTFLDKSKKFSERDVHRYLARQQGKGEEAPFNLVWRDKNHRDAAYTSMGVDWKHPFVNSYLVGIRPFKAENNWLPLYVISKLKTYQYDKEQYGAVEVWQNSAQAMKLPRGDCEDHALALADWLISEGVDARVVIGKYKNGGHAWVVAKINQRTYLLEATSKRVRKNWNHLPLASLSYDYFPTHMFNRTEFWVNTNKDLTQDYQGVHWVKTSKFKNTR